MSMKLPALPEAHPRCKVTVLNAGFYQASMHLLKKGNPKRKIWGPALFYLITHPKHGHLLFDTGYSTRFYEATHAYPYRLLRSAIPVRITEQDNAIRQLKAMGISPDEVTVILSHLHVDHAAGIHDFPNSRTIISKTEWEFTRQSPLKLLFHSYLKSLFDGIAADRLQLIDFEHSASYGPFTHACDLFQDGTLILVPLPGHAIGQMGLLVNCSPEERYFLIADAAYVRGNYRQNKTGAWMSRLAHHHFSQYKANFPLLNQLEQDNPRLVILPSHDPDVYDYYVKNKPAP
ncbi:MBL fold metallo-hydrolase [Paenibacillus senegalensis]|uniref:MBL fold metallo-hydrolase n=1 Tax=Paenibacillus senegalensis TaxID=1465766 RepID=UPI000287DB03|nr:MBL fold metallo-hydrolase [Paenibacillus senegalensis]